MFFYKQPSTGTWFGAKMSASQVGTDWPQRYAVACGAAVDDITEVESESDPRTGTLLTEPTPPAPELVPTLGEQLAPALAVVASDPALKPETKDALLAMINLLAGGG